MARVLLMQGANMAWLGRRQPELYGRDTAAELDARVEAHARRLGLSLDIFYTHVEGEAIGRLYEAVDAGLDGLVMNPAGFSRTGYALRDAIVGCARLPYVEVHVTNVEKRGIRSVLAEAAMGVIAGFGLDGYRLALDAMAAHLERAQTP
ncbi:MAG: type II 3-dehydroquinate dehydratase [Acidobacteria bacterium]|nr:type II 3-dehydroquinate dehydratase [Acidobacteriota bacterium]